MLHLKTKIGYTSLKIQYQEKQHREFPRLGGFCDQEQDGFSRMIEQDMDDDTLAGEEDSLVNPIAKRDAKIVCLEKKLSDFNAIKEKLRHKDEELMLVKKNSRLATIKLGHVKKVTEQRMLECMPDPKFKDDYSHHLASIYATCEDPDDYTFNQESDAVEVCDENSLLKNLEENCDMTIEKNKDAITFLKNKVIENVKIQVKRSRRKRDSSTGSITSTTSNGSKRKSRSDHNVTEPKSSKLAVDLKASSLPKPV